MRSLVTWSAGTRMVPPSLTLILTGYDAIKLGGRRRRRHCDSRPEKRMVLGGSVMRARYIEEESGQDRGRAGHDAETRCTDPI